MPYLGQSPFLQQPASHGLRDNFRFQCPISGNRHFYGASNRDLRADEKVSMPYLGQSPFLRRARLTGEGSSDRFQCPISGNRHFYLEGTRGQYKAPWVSMPYLGQSPFLQKQLRLLCDPQCEFQCPISGNRHFYKEKKMKENIFSVGFNALSRAIAISTRSGLSFLMTFRRVSMPYLGQSPFLPKLKHLYCRI